MTTDTKTYTSIQQTNNTMKNVIPDRALFLLTGVVGGCGLIFVFMAIQVQYTPTNPLLIGLAFCSTTGFLIGASTLAKYILEAMYQTHIQPIRSN